MGTLPTHVIRRDDPRPCLVSLDEWVGVRTHRSRFRYNDFAVEFHPFAVKGRFVVSNHEVWGETSTYCDNLDGVVQILCPHADPAQIRGTIGNHPWSYVADDEVTVVQRLAANGNAIDDCGHELPTDVTPLEARLVLLSDFPGYCLSSMVLMRERRASNDGLCGRVDPQAIDPNRSPGKTDRGWGNGGGYSGRPRARRWESAAWT